MHDSDAALLERWRGGDQSAGEELFERYYDPIERFFLNKVSAGIEDLVQETFIRCIESRERIMDTEKFRSYLFSIAYRVLCGHLRETYRSGHAIDFDADSVCQLTSGPSTLLARRREHRLLLEALRNIPVDHQVLLELHYWEQMTTQGIADVLGIPVGTVRGRLQRARAQLEQVMESLAGSHEELESTMSGLEDWAGDCRAQLSSYRLATT